MSSPALTRADMHSYQVDAVKHIRLNKHAALWLQMGLGKTAAVLTALRDMLDDREIEGPVLIVAPKRVAEHVWPSEPQKWRHLHALSSTLIVGSPDRRKRLLRENTDLHIIGVDLLKWLVGVIGKNKWPYRTVVLDEASGYKNPKSMRFRSMRSVLPRIERLIEMTGTPAPNGPADLWSQLYMLDRGDRLGKTLGVFRERYFRRGNPHINEFIIQDGAEERIQKKVADLCLTMTAVDHLDMPERFDITVPVELPPEARKMYETLERNFVLSFADGDEAAAETQAQLANKLLQVCNGVIYTDEGNKRLHDAKIDALSELVESGENMLVAYRFISDRERIMEAFPEATDVRTPGAVEAWNKGLVEMMVMHPLSAGHGLNLQDGGRVMVWYGLPWSLEQYEQANARLHRQGQRNSVSIYHMIAEGTVDNAVANALRSKAASQDALLQATKQSALTRIRDLDWLL